LPNQHFLPASGKIFSSNMGISLRFQKRDKGLFELRFGELHFFLRIIRFDFLNPPNDPLLKDFEFPNNHKIKPKTKKPKTSAITSKFPRLNLLKILWIITT